MPIFEFICGECESDFEKIVSSSGGAGSVDCPECGSKSVHKKLSLFGVGAAKASSGGGPSSWGSAPPSGGCCGGFCSGH